MNTLLITSFFDPITGGSAVVYRNLHKYSNGSLFVLTARRDCHNGQMINDINDIRNEKNRVFTVDLLRAPYIQSKNLFHSLFLMFRYDIPIMFHTLLKLVEIIRNNKVSTVIIGELHSLSWCAKYIKFFYPHIKIVYYIHGEEITTKMHSRRFNLNSRKRLQQADAIICVSSFTQSILLAEWGVSPSKVKLIVNGIDLNILKPTIDDKNNSLINLERKFIFSVGRHIERKGFDNLIFMMTELLQHEPDILLYIGGEGEQTPKLKALVEQLGLTTSVIFLGKLSSIDLALCYQHCYCFVMPNRTLANGDTEGFGLVFLEANAYGKPAIAGKAGGAVDAVRNGYSGYLVDPTSPAQIAEAVLKLNDPIVYKNICTNAIDFVNAHDVQQKVAEVLTLCRTLSNNNKNNSTEN